MEIDSHVRTVWVTRAEPGARATAARLDALGFSPLVAPLLVTRPVAATFNLNDIAALAFTSGNGVRAFAEVSDRRDIAVFAVGDATAHAARMVGFREVASADDDGAALARLIIQARPVGRVLCPGPRDRAGDMPGALRRAGITVDAVTLYETVPLIALPESLHFALAEQKIGAVLIHSARAADAFARLAQSYDLSRMKVLSLSNACLRPLANLKVDRIAARAPREDALLDALLAAFPPALGKPPSAR